MKLFSVAVVTLAAASAFAAKSNTGYYYQPAGGGQAVELKYNMNSKPGKTGAAGGGAETDNKSTTGDFKVGYWYGLSEGNALGVHTSTGSEKTTVGTTDTTKSGMTDLFIGYKGFSDMWHYGVDLGYNIGGKAKSDNRSSGGISLTPNVGILIPSGALNYGADLSYRHNMEATFDNSGSDTKFTRGSHMKLAPFLEWNYGMGFLGGELSYNMVGDTTIKGNNGAADTKNKGEGYLNLKVFASYDFNDMVTGLADVGMGMHSEHDTDDSATTTKEKAYTETDVNIGVRLSF